MWFSQPSFFVIFISWVKAGLKLLHFLLLSEDHAISDNTANLGFIIISKYFLFVIVSDQSCPCMPLTKLWYFFGIPSRGSQLWIFFVSIVDLNKKYTINILKPDKLLTEEIDLTKDLLIEIKLDAAKEMVTGKLNTEDSLFQGNVTLNGNVKVLDNIVKKEETT